MEEAFFFCLPLYAHKEHVTIQVELYAPDPSHQVSEIDRRHITTIFVAGDEQVVRR